MHARAQTRGARMTRVLLLGLLAAASGFLPPTRRATPTHSVSMGAKKRKALVSPDGGVVAAPAIEEAEAAADVAADPTAAPAPAAADGHAEAMGRFRTWPITAAGELEPVLRAMGLKIDARKVDGTSSADAALSDALVSVGASGRGGTGSFVSDDQGRKRMIQRRFNVSVPRTRVSKPAPTLREHSER